MDFTKPVSEVMTRHLVTVLPTDKLDVVRDIFEKQNIHHLPVVRFKTLLGIISKTDLLNFRKGLKISPAEQLEEKVYNEASENEQFEIYE